MRDGAAFRYLMVYNDNGNDKVNDKGDIDGVG